MLETAGISLQGIGAFIAYFGTSIVLLMAFVLIYVTVTPYKEIQLIKENNTAAALSFTGALAGFAIPLGGAIVHSVSLPDMFIWGLVAMTVQVLTYFAVRAVFPKLAADIPENHIPKGIILGAISVVTGYLNAMCMTY